jgi:hypothetical protein
MSSYLGKPRCALQMWVDVRSYEDEAGCICAQTTPEYVYCPNPYTSGGICWSSWTNFVASFLVTAFDTPTLRFSNTSTSVTSTTSLSSCVLENASGNSYYVTSFTWTASRQGPCCLDCSIGGGTVQLLVWPTPARYRSWLKKVPILHCNSTPSILSDTHADKVKHVAIHLCHI